MNRHFSTVAGARALFATVVVAVLAAGCASEPIRPIPYDQANTTTWFDSGISGGLGRTRESDLDQARDAREAGEYAAAAETYRGLARRGVVEAAYELGKAYRYGHGVPRDKEQAAAWFIAVLQTSNPRKADASYHLGTMMLDGEGVPRDFGLARRLLEQAIEGGNQSAALPLARIYGEGLGVEPEPARALELARRGVDAGDVDSYFWLMRAYRADGVFGEDRQRVATLSQELEVLLQQRVQEKDPEAMRGLAILYLEGLGRPRNVGLAADWLGRAALAGRPDYMTSLGGDLLRGTDELPADPQAAVRLLEIAAEHHRQADAYALLGEAYRDGNGVARDVEKAEAWLAKGVAAGSVAAHREYGRLLADRRSDPQALARAAELLEVAARQGMPYAMADLGTLHVERAFPGADPATGIDYLHRAHEAGIDSATSELGQALLEGRGVAADPGRAEALLLRAAEKGQGGAMITLANAYLDGTGVARQPAKARHWLERAAESGNEGARLTLGRALLSGEIRGDARKGYDIVREAAEGGDTFAMMELGRALRDGTVIKPDRREASEWFRRAMQAGAPDAESTLASMLFDRAHGQELDIEGLTNSAELGHAGAMSVLGQAYLTGEGAEQNPILALSWLDQAVEAGNMKAAATLGQAQLYGEYGLDREPERGLSLLEQAAAAGETTAQRELGHALVKGEIVERDVARGRDLLRDAASRSDVYAMELLGNLYLDGGEGFEPDAENGELWLSRAAEEGDVSAMTRLGIAYIEGEPLEVDRDRGMEMLARAAEAGDNTARAALGRIYLFGKYGIEADSARGTALLEKAVDQGHAGAMSALGRAHVNGIDGERNIAEGARLLFAAARAGHPTAKYALAEAFLRSRGLPGANRDYAESWLRTVVAGDSAVAVETLTEMLRDANVTIPESEEDWQHYEELRNAKG